MAPRHISKGTRVEKVRLIKRVLELAVDRGWGFERIATVLGISPTALMSWKNGGMPAASIPHLESVIRALETGGVFEQLGRKPTTMKVDPPNPKEDVDERARNGLREISLKVLKNISTEDLLDELNSRIS